MIEVLDHSPEALTAAERLLLVALAEKARDDTRQVLWPRGANPRHMLCSRLGVSESGLTKILRRLAANGLDVRVPFACDKAGRPIYAHEGRSSEFRIPHLENDAERVPSGAPTEPAPEGTHKGTRGHPLEPESLPARAALVRQSVRSPDAREAADLVLSRYPGCFTDDEALAVVESVARRNRPHNLVNYVAKISSDDLARHRPTSSRAAPARCPHNIPRGERITGAGKNASRICQECDRELPPATDAGTP